jgi:polar amino acid transport system permease protein
VADAEVPESILILSLGAGTTIAVAFAGNVLGLALGLLVCVMRLSSSAFLRAIAAAYVSIFRGVPLLVQLLIVYYFLPVVGLDLPPFVAAVIGLGICSAAYQSENLRGGFLIVPRGQVEAALAFGYTRWQTLLQVVMPQAFRAAAPSVMNEITLIVKASSLVSVVGVADLTRASQNIVARDLRPIEWYAAAGVIYLLISLVLAWLGRAAERRLNLGYVKGAV